MSQQPDQVAARSQHISRAHRGPSRGAHPRSFRCSLRIVRLASRATCSTCVIQPIVCHETSVLSTRSVVCSFCRKQPRHRDAHVIASFSATPSVPRRDARATRGGVVPGACSFPTCAHFLRRSATKCPVSHFGTPAGPSLAPMPAVACVMQPLSAFAEHTDPLVRRPPLVPMLAERARMHRQLPACL